MKKWIKSTALLAGLLSMNLAFAAPQDAVAQVRGNATQVLKILDKSNGSNKASILKEAEQYASPYFDFERMTRLAVGQYWNQATAAQKETLVQEFKTLLIRTYAHQMFVYKNAQVTVHDQPVVKAGGKTVDVKVTVQPQGGKPVQMVFNTSPSGNKYLVHNLVIEGAINLVVAQNKQFALILQQKGIDGLIADLKEKNGSK